MRRWPPSAGAAATDALLLNSRGGPQLVHAGVDLITVAELMRHGRLETTRIYTRATRPTESEPWTPCWSIVDDDTARPGGCPGRAPA